ncbi:gamma-tubulin complex, DGRIP91/SPC98 component protein [Mycena amicta]|nr:gamma-tubulin complex, DGRIP91/SPC98 component protein [Mycena amicta]
MTLFPLPDIHEFDYEAEQAVLPGLGFRPQFFMPIMLDKPQNPIIDTLKLHNSAVTVAQLPKELASLIFNPPPQIFAPLADSMWTDALKQGATSSEIFSWDALRPDYSGRPSPSPFLSEQDGLVVAAARYYVYPRLREPGTELKYLTQQELLAGLKTTVLGLSSPLHTWDAASERFVPLVVQKGARGILLLDDKDETLSSSFMERFLRIGTLLRRLEILVADLRGRFAKEGPTVHAFAHALSTILAYLRDKLADCSHQGSDTSPILVAIWSEYKWYEDILAALGTLCGRAEHTIPENYLLPDHDPINLLSLIHDHVQIHLERQSPKAVTAILAYILTTTSRDYFQQISRSVGFGGDKGVIRNPRQHEMDVDKDDEDEEDLVEVDPSVHGQSFPTFFSSSSELVDILPAAQKSLFLLRAAEPEHPLLRDPKTQVKPLCWFWTSKDIEAASNGEPSREEEGQLKQESWRHPSSSSDVVTLMSQFRVFDLEPGIEMSAASPSAALCDFIETFPETLPPITPTLAHLTSLVLQPLAAHAATLSRALLALFIAPTSHFLPTIALQRRHLLQFRSHVQLLHSFLLLASPSFKSRLSAALFSDLEGFGAGEAIPSSLRALRGKSAKFTAQRRDAGDESVRRGQQWAVGLSFALLERGTWPPVGADLSFFLRTVIVDSFDGKLLDGDGEHGTRDIFWVEAEKRLGFAIRDLPTEQGHDRWLNPLSIEALDFLYIDYKPPHPLDILLTPDILSKYQRMFTYLLRIMRVQHALSAVFRMSRSAQRPLFPTLAKSNQLLLHFRFIAQSFVQNLSSYVLDTAISGNFEPFLAWVSLPSSGYSDAHFTDVFSLAKAHSQLMDDVLAACLLRSSQRVAGDLLRQALELVLEFSVVVGERWEGRLEEYQAAPVLEELAGRFRRRMGSLIRALKLLVDKGPTEEVDIRRDGRQPTGGVQAVAHFLESLTEWWTQ